MVDREKVIKGLECCIAYRTDSVSCGECPYGMDSDCWQVERDALELLKEQEPVKPKEERLNDVDSIFRCGNCGTHFYYRQQKYCVICGRAVKWND